MTLHPTIVALGFVAVRQLVHIMDAVPSGL
jgi:hypothetical protein